MNLLQSPFKWCLLYSNCIYVELANFKHLYVRANYRSEIPVCTSAYQEVACNPIWTHNHISSRIKFCK